MREGFPVRNTPPTFGYQTSSEKLEHVALFLLFSQTEQNAKERAHGEPVQVKQGTLIRDRGDSGWRGGAGGRLRK